MPGFVGSRTAAVAGITPLRHDREAVAVAVDQQLRDLLHGPRQCDCERRAVIKLSVIGEKRLDRRRLPQKAVRPQYVEKGIELRGRVAAHGAAAEIRRYCSAAP